MTAEVINTKQGLTRIPTYAELIKEIDREKFKTNDIRKIFDRNAWYFHESPQGQALNTNNIHPADLEQMNFKKMAEEATARKEEETPNLDFEDMTDLRDDAISDFEMSFDREAELREENERRVAEQANLSHSQDHYIAQRHKKHLNKPNPKQIEQQKKTDEEMKRIKHQEIIDYLNATFPSYPDG